MPLEIEEMSAFGGFWDKWAKTNLLLMFIALHPDQFFLNLYYEMPEEKGRESIGKRKEYSFGKCRLWFTKIIES